MVRNEVRQLRAFLGKIECRNGPIVKLVKLDQQPGKGRLSDAPPRGADDVERRCLAAGQDIEMRWDRLSLRGSLAGRDRHGLNPPTPPHTVPLGACHRTTPLGKRPQSDRPQRERRSGALWYLANLRRLRQPG